MWGYVVGICSTGVVWWQSCMAMVIFGDGNMGGSDVWCGGVLNRYNFHIMHICGNF